MKIYRLVPDAPATDPGWDNAPSLGEITVRAESPADARIVAAAAEIDFPDVDALPGDGVTTSFASAVRDEKLYRVEEDTSGRFPAEGARAVLDGLMGPQEIIKPLED